MDKIEESRNIAQRVRATLPEIAWDDLSQEFERFEPDREALEMDSASFLLSLASPTPRFVEYLLESRLKDRSLDPDHVKTLFFFLLRKRYAERLNLLYFAFDLFDDDCRLPDELVDQTPFPHEDGVPRYALRLDRSLEW